MVGRYEAECVEAVAWSKDDTSSFFNRDEAVRRDVTKKVQRENNTRDELQRGAYLKDVFSRHGVL